MISSIHHVLLLSSLFLLVSACANKKPSSPEATKPSYRLLSSKEASKWVVTDEKEQFFEKVAPLEMAIQLHKSQKDKSRDAILPLYKTMLQEDLQDFTPAEEEAVKKVFDYALELCYKIDPNLQLPEIFLIKTTGKYYGPSVYYTRDNSIIIPAPMVPSDKSLEHEAFLSTMIHEIFHVYSRYNKDKRDALYARIGFERLPNLQLSEFLQKRVLYNPDGVDLRYAITVEDKKTGRSFKGVPVIYSRYKAFMPSLPNFFGYLVFQLFEVEQQDDKWVITTPNTGYSIDEVKGFWKQVTRNTNYNIHPDELCADNFVLLALSKAENANNLAKLSPEGQQLVKDLEAIILNK
ncbi:MAG: hypothetical protein ACRBFS_15755 [Aureispira sp.]